MTPPVHPESSATSSPEATATPRRIVLIADDEDVAAAFQVKVVAHAHELRRVESINELFDGGAFERADVVVLGAELGEREVSACAHELRILRPGLPVVLLAHRDEREIALSALRNGFDDVLSPTMSAAELDACWSRVVQFDDPEQVPANDTSDVEAAQIVLEPGWRVPGTPYRIDRWLGEGGMGDVFQATHMQIQRKLALKALASRHCTDRRCVRTFRNEARASARIGAPNIVDIYDILELPDGRVILCMEFVDGTPLDELIDDASFDLPRLLAVTRQLCKGLAAAHETGIVHRDIKPANIMVTSRGGTPDFVKILDFGIAAIQADLRSDEPVAGTPEYMAPETLKKQSPAGSADLYAVGCLLYEWACGRRPYEGAPKSVIASQVYEPVPNIDEHKVREFPPAFGEVVTRCLQKDPADRYADMDELEAALLDVQLDFECVTSWDHLPLPRVDDERRQSLVERFDALKAPPVAPPRRRRWGFLTTVAMLAIAGVGYAALTFGPERFTDSVLAAAVNSSMGRTFGGAAATDERGSAVAPFDADAEPAVAEPAVAAAGLALSAADPVAASMGTQSVVEPELTVTGGASPHDEHLSANDDGALDSANDDDSAKDARDDDEQTRPRSKEGRLKARLARDPNDVAAMDDLAAYYFESKDYRDSAEYARMATKATPADGRRWLKLGHAEYKLFRYANALEAYEKANELGDEFASEHISVVESKLSL